jgi:hypothetical protein
MEAQMRLVKKLPSKLMLHDWKSLNRRQKFATILIQTFISKRNRNVSDSAGYKFDSTKCFDLFVQEASK